MRTTLPHRVLFWRHVGCREIYILHHCPLERGSKGSSLKNLGKIEYLVHSSSLYHQNQVANLIK